MSKTYVELLIEGPDEFARGYVSGFVAARGSHAELIFDSDAGFADDGFLQKIKEALHISAHITHCIVDEETAQLVREATDATDESLLTIRSDRFITSASFAYEFEIFNRENGAKFQARLADLPAGVALEDHALEETLDPSAKGPELFSPAHDYALAGNGTAQGPIDKIVWLYKEFDSFDQVEAHPIHVRYAE
ncbi:MAG: hypothetical protein P9L99_05560 [Candidatus Lernaella stagnicola]|nr:hypothetical protein [Candidatus Lernaella stagnicola]